MSLRQHAREWALAVLAGVAVAWFALGCALLGGGGCAAFRKPPAPPPLESSVAPCADPQPRPATDDTCEGSTPDGFRCVWCDVPRGCLQTDAVVYCTPACSDPYCTGPVFGRGRR